MNISQLLESLKDPSITLSISDKLLAGVSVALLSMTVVFIVLVIISLIISLLKREKQNKNTQIEVFNIEKDIKEDENIEELISVITAAIVSSNENNSIVVRKIIRTNNSKSNWERMSKNITK